MLQIAYVGFAKPANGWTCPREVSGPGSPSTQKGLRRLLARSRVDPYGIVTMMIEFSDCNDGLLTYEITTIDPSGENPIQRIVSVNASLQSELIPTAGTNAFSNQYQCAGVVDIGVSKTKQGETGRHQDNEIPAQAFHS